MANPKKFCAKPTSNQEKDQLLRFRTFINIAITTTFEKVTCSFYTELLSRGEWEDRILMIVKLIQWYFIQLSKVWVPNSSLIIEISYLGDTCLRSSLNLSTHLRLALIIQAKYGWHVIIVMLSLTKLNIFHNLVNNGG